LENPKERSHLGNQIVDGRIIIKFILKEKGVKLGTGIKWLRDGLVNWNKVAQKTVLGTGIKWLRRRSWELE
jgi:hypothetical protein